MVSLRGSKSKKFSVEGGGSLARLAGGVGPSLAKPGDHLADPLSVIVTVDVRRREYGKETNQPTFSGPREDQHRR